MKLTTQLLALLLLSFLIACKPQKNDKDTAHSLLQADTVALAYAKGFNITKHESYKRLVIYNPWSNKKNEPYAIYYLYDGDGNNVPQDGFKVKIPIESAAVNTFAYFEFLHQLNELSKITGVTDIERIYSPQILERLSKNEIVNLGDPFDSDLEKTLLLMPDIIIKSAYAQQDTSNERLERAGIPIVYTLEWMENSPLARSEWIKMIALFFDKLETSEEVFKEIEANYNEMKNLVAQNQTKVSVLSGDRFQDTWYVPGGNSYNANLFKDAGINYKYASNEDSGSIGLDMETVMTQFAEADVWIGSEADSYKELMNRDKKYGLFKAVKNQRVFNNRNRTTPSGGNDYFESAIAFPHLVLSDLIKAAYPELMQHEAFNYIKPLEK